MNKSDSIKEIGKGLILFATKVDKIAKTAENPFFKSKYAPLPEILEAIKIPLAESGLIFAQFPDGDALTTIIIHPESGEWMESSCTMHPVKSDPQSIGSAITFQRRYSLCAILGLNVDSDDDGNEASTPKEYVSGPNGEAVDKPWLNKNTPEFEKAKAFIDKATDKAAAFKAIRSQYKVSKETAELLK